MWCLENNIHDSEPFETEEEHKSKDIACNHQILFSHFPAGLHCFDHLHHLSIGNKNSNVKIIIFGLDFYNECLIFFSIQKSCYVYCH